MQVKEFFIKYGETSKPAEHGTQPKFEYCDIYESTFEDETLFTRLHLDLADKLTTMNALKSQDPKHTEFFKNSHLKIKSFNLKENQYNLTIQLGHEPEQAKPIQGLIDEYKVQIRRLVEKEIISPPDAQLTCSYAQACRAGKQAIVVG